MKKRDHMYCRQCGEQIPDNARFCPPCGNRSEQPNTNENSITLRQGSTSGAGQRLPEPFSSGTRLDTFVITRLIGEGGSGRVYEANDDFDGSSFRLKVVPNAEESAFRLIRDEFVQG